VCVCVCVENLREENRRVTLKTCTLFPALMSIVLLVCHGRPNTAPERLLSALVILARARAHTHTHTITHICDPVVSLSISVSGGRKRFDRNFKKLMASCMGSQRLCQHKYFHFYSSNRKTAFSFVFTAQCKRHFTFLIYARPCCFMHIVGRLTRERCIVCLV